MVVPRLFFAFIVGLLLCVSISTLADPIASIDRSVIALDDTMTLTIRVNEAGSFKGPDLSPLERDFQVLGNSQSSRHMISNGRSESWTEWIITLLPKRKGQLTIPPINVEGKATQAITVNVQASIPKPSGYLEPVYLESEVDQTSVYVQQQLIFTLRIFQSIQLDSMNISEPEFDNAVMEKLGQNSFQRRIQNTPYRVHELRYAIFPQQTGEFIIPELVFSANEAVARRSVFSLQGQGKPIRKMSKQHSINVKAPAAAFTGNTWLPAKSITLDESWSSDPDTTRVGDSITRSVTLKADGLLDSQLPPFEFTTINGAKMYPDQGSSETTITDSGVVASRIDSAAIIPTREGLLELPEVRFSWWNTNTNKMQQAVIPAQHIEVKAALNNGQSASTPLAVDHSLASMPGVNTVNSSNDSGLVVWQVISAFLAAGWLLTIYFAWQLKKVKHLPIETPATQTPKSLSEKQAFKLLSKACSSDDYAAIRLRLIDWARCYWPNGPIYSLQDIQLRCTQSTSTLHPLILELESALYSDNEENSRYDSNRLIAEITSLRQGKNTGGTEQQPLPTLYSN